MNGYLLSAAGVIFLSVIVSLIIPEGKLNKSVTFVMRLVCIFVLIQPVVKLFVPGNNPEEVTRNLADYSYVEEIYSGHQSRQMEELLLKEFGETTECNVTVEYVGEDFKVIAAEIKLSEKNQEKIDGIYEYLIGLGYINITVYA